MADPKLEEIRTRWEAATPGPWSGDIQSPESRLGRVRAIEGPSHIDLVVAGGLDYVHGRGGTGFGINHIEGTQANLHAIIAAPTDIAWLIKQAEELSALKARAAAEIDALRAKIAGFERGSSYLMDPRVEWGERIALLERVVGSDV